MGDGEGEERGEVSVGGINAKGGSGGDHRKTISIFPLLCMCVCVFVPSHHHHRRRWCHSSLSLPLASSSTCCTYHTHVARSVFIGTISCAFRCVDNREWGGGTRRRRRRKKIHSIPVLSTELGRRRKRQRNSVKSRLSSPPPTSFGAINFISSFFSVGNPWLTFSPFSLYPVPPRPRSQPHQNASQPIRISPLLSPPFFHSRNGENSLAR